MCHEPDVGLSLSQSRFSSQLLMDMDENVLKTGPQQIDELVPTAYQLRGTGSKVSWDPFL